MTEEFTEEEPTKPSGEPKLPTTYWLTRDRRHGELSKTVEVWAVRPERVRMHDGDVMWLAPSELIDVVDTHVDDWTIGRCLRECRVYPETDRECVRVGEEPIALSSVS